MNKVVVAIIMWLLACALLWLWFANGAMAQSSAFDRVCVCRAAYCWAQFVDAPDVWQIVLWGWEVRLPDVTQLWNLGTDWRC